MFYLEPSVGIEPTFLYLRRHAPDKAHYPTYVTQHILVGLLLTECPKRLVFYRGAPSPLWYFWCPRGDLNSQALTGGSLLSYFVCRSNTRTYYLFFLFLLPQVVVCWWQFGQTNLRLLIELSKWFPLIWSKCKTISFSNHFCKPHILHLYSIILFLITLLLKDALFTGHPFNLKTCSSEIDLLI